MGIETDMSGSMPIFETLEPRLLLSGAIEGQLWNDLDGDGVKDPEEAVLEGWTIFLDANSDGMLNPAGSVEPDDYTSGAELNNVIPEATLSAIDAGSSTVYATDDPSHAVTGDSVFGHESGHFWQTERLRVDFTTPVYSVSIDCASMDIGAGRLEIYDAGDNLLDTYVTQVLGSGEWEAMSLDRPEGDIAYAIAGSNGGADAVLDNLQFGEGEVYVVTDSSGDYAFTDVEPGTYTIAEVLQDGWGQTYPAAMDQSFHFTVTADPRNYHAEFGETLDAINNLVGGPGAFHVSPGDIDQSIPDNRAVIDAYFGADALWYAGVGNHEAETSADMAWLRDEYNNGNGIRTPLKNFTNQDGPATSIETTYTWDFGNAHFIQLNEYWDGYNDRGTNGDIVPELLAWLAADLAANTRPYVFVFGHEPAFPQVRHVGDSLDAYPKNRDAFWQLLEDYDVHAYFCGHTHNYYNHQGDKNHVGDVWQIDAGSAGNPYYSPGLTFIDVTVTGTEVTYDVYADYADYGDYGETWGKLEGWSESTNYDAPRYHTVVLDSGQILEDIDFGSRYDTLRVIHSSVQEGDLLSIDGSLRIEVGFDWHVETSDLDQSDFELIGGLNGRQYADTWNYNPATEMLTLDYTNLPDDRYTLRLYSGDGQFENTYGTDLDGEATAWPIPPNVSGNGRKGGDFVVEFSTDVVTAPYPTQFEAVLPLGSLIYDSPVTGTIGFVGDTDTYTIDIDAGMTIAAVVAPDNALAASIQLLDPSDAIIASATGAVGVDAMLQSVAAATPGTYKVIVSGAGGTVGMYGLRIILNAAVEDETYDGPSNDDAVTAQNLNGNLIDLGVGSSQRAAVLGTFERRFQADAAFPSNEDIGSPNIAGSYSYDAGTEVHTVAGGGRDIWDNWDQFHYAYQAFSGDGEIIARVVSFADPNGINGWAKAGVMVRETLSAGSKHALMTMSYTYGSAFQYRPKTDNSSFNYNPPPNERAPYWVKLVRQGDQFTGYQSADGSDGSWVRVSTATIPMSADVYVGLAVSAHETSGHLCTAEFDNVKIYSGQAESDWYSFELDDGETAGAVLTTQMLRSTTLELYDSSLDLLAGGVAATNVDQAISDFRDLTSNGVVDTYYAKVSGVDVDYSLVITRNANFDTEPNDDPPEAQDITGTGVALGYADAADPDDYYSFSVVAGDLLTITTATPGDGPGEFVNTLDPGIELYDPSGAMVAFDGNGAGDGHNATLTHTAAISGVYVARIMAGADTRGEYILTIDGHSGALPDFAAVSMIPSGSEPVYLPTQITVNFNDGVLLTSLDPDDLMVDGLPATGVTAIDGDTAVFDVVVSATSGPHSGGIAAGAIMDLQGTPIEAFTAEFVVDATPPTVTSIIINDGLDLGSRVDSIAFTFDEDVVVSSDALQLHNDTTGEDFFPPLAAFDPTSSTWDVLAAGLTDGHYTARLLASQIADTVGNALDGDGDAAPGGDYTFALSVLIGDIDGDLVVDSGDLETFVSQFGLCQDALTGDFNGDGWVDLGDFTIMRGSLGNMLLPAAPAGLQAAGGPIAAAAAPVVPVVSQSLGDDNDANDDSIAIIASVAAVDLLMELPSAVGYISEPQPIALGRPATMLQRAATAGYDLRPLGDDPATDGQADDLLADILAESPLAAAL